MRKFSRLGILCAAVLAAVIGLQKVEPVKAEEETKIVDGVYIGNVNVSGLTESQAQSAVDEYVAGLMNTTFTLKGETGSIEMTAEDMGVAADSDAAVQEALGVGHAGSLVNRYKALQDLKKEKLVLDMNLSVDKQSTAQKLYENSGSLAVGAVDNSLVRENGAFRFVPGQEGEEIDIVNSVYAINDFLAQGWDGSSNEIDLVTKVVEPRGSEEELAQVQDLLGAYSTNFASSSAGRAKNVTTGCSKVNGTILYPGDEFELCSTVSPFTQENGYELAGAYQNGTTVESFGGGICQVATTLYNAVIRAELDITMRFNHSMQVHYVQPSMDAAIAGNYKDLRFKNNTEYPVYIEGYCSGGIIYFNVFGKETRPANREISFESETVSTTQPETKFNLDATKAAGYWSQDQSAHEGCVAQLWKIVTVDGKQQSRELFNKSNYQASPKIITIGTKGASEEGLAALKAAVATGDEAKVKSAVAGLQKTEEPEDKEDDNKDKSDKKDKDSSDKKKDDKKDKDKDKDKKDEKEDGGNKTPSDDSDDNQDTD
ncbi:MAG: VanW family protein [Lachnospiraceae bacterium]|nr:VanW family protein [Lachnospiraceae bacterium]